MSESTGTITVTNGSASVTGSGTLFAANFVSANDILVVDGAMYVVKSVTSDTALTLTQPYAGTTASGKSYDIVHLTGETVITLLARKTTELVEKYGDVANAVQTVPGAGAIPQADEDGKIADGWVNLPQASTATPQTSADAGSAGTSAQYARGDHVHPRRPEVKVYVDGESDSTIIAATKEGDLVIRMVSVDE